MRFLHISDLHLGKVICGVSMLENGDQPRWIDAFLDRVTDLRPDAVLIAGDVYDRSSPAGAAVQELSRLVEGLAERGACVLLVAGNHDSGQRLAFARDILAKQNVHIAGEAARELTRVTLEDEYGPVTFWLLPYVFPAAAAKILEDATIRDYDTAVRRLLEAQNVDPAERNVIVAHQNVTAFGSEMPRAGSESAVGGVGQVDYTAFDAFDYAALGHIHGSYPVGRDTVRYAGSPLCYHFNETRQAPKGPILVEMGRKGAPLRMETLHIPPLHPMREMRGEFEALREKELAGTGRGEYLRLAVTDRPMTPEIADFFRSLAELRGSILMETVSEYRRFAEPVRGPGSGAEGEKSTEELFAEYYADRSGGETPDEADMALLRRSGELLRNSPPDPRQRAAVDPALTEALLRYLRNGEAERA